MNDRHLYKAKRTDNGEWVEGYYFCMVHTDGRHAHHFIIPLGADLSKGRAINKIQVEVDPSTICQCTGLTDKNGKLIWENDVVRHDMSDTIGTVKWYKEDYVGWCVDDVQVNEQQFTDEMWDECEVIGNIFDNPELLEVES